MKSGTVMAFFSKKKQAPQITRAEALSGTPTKNPMVHCEVQENGTTLLSYPLAIRPIWTQLLEKYSKKEESITKKLELDAMGSEVWTLIDGTREVRDIILFFAKSHGISNHEAELSVSLFLRELGKRKIIAIA